MHSIFSTKYSTIISLLHKDYSVCKIQFKASIEKYTIGRIKKEVDTDKKNKEGGRPSKLLSYHKQSILYQITTRKLDNAV
jgi:hypothetical protein